MDEERKTTLVKVLGIVACTLSLFFILSLISDVFFRKIELKKEQDGSTYIINKGVEAWYALHLKDIGVGNKNEQSCYLEKGSKIKRVGKFKVSTLILGDEAYPIYKIIGVSSNRDDICTVGLFVHYHADGYWEDSKTKIKGEKR
ncbi:MAG: hypothetical protein PHY40_03035 [Patescibacteria group bacterium]|nr:hypothetical protein [Patescibacteria group bacterium]